jgi:hypothetical protein
VSRSIDKVKLINGRATMTTEDAIERFVEEGREDHVGLWQIIRAVREDLGIIDAEEVRRATLGMVEELLREGRMRPGRPTLDWRGFEPWRLSPGEALHRIDREWHALGREPSLWEVVWFDTPNESDEQQGASDDSCPNSPVPAS